MRRVLLALAVTVGLFALIELGLAVLGFVLGFFGLGVWIGPAVGFYWTVGAIVLAAIGGVVYGLQPAKD